jgi:hypothetical protein
MQEQTLGCGSHLLHSCLRLLTLLLKYYAGAYRQCVGNVVAYQSSYRHPIKYQQILVLNITFRHAYSGLNKRDTRLPTTLRRSSMPTAYRLPSSALFHAQFRNQFIAMASHDLERSRLYSVLDTCSPCGKCRLDMIGSE